MARKSNAAPKIFLCYSHKNREFGIELVQHLRQTIGREDAVWYDDGLRAGDVWWTKIMRELANSNIFIVILSQESIKSAWVKEEILTAWKRHLNKKMQFVPILYRPYKKLPPELAFLDNRQFISFLPSDDYAIAYKKLTAALNITLAEEHTASKTENVVSSNIEQVMIKSPIKASLKSADLRLLMQFIEESYMRHNWYCVIEITNALLKLHPEVVSDAIREMHEFAYLYSFSEKINKNRYKNAQYALKELLKHIKEPLLRLELLDAYVITLIEQGMQNNELVECIKEAIKLAPDNLYWKELQNSLPLKDMNEKHLPGVHLPKAVLGLLPVAFFILPFFRYFLRKK